MPSKFLISISFSKTKFSSTISTNSFYCFLHSPLTLHLQSSIISGLWLGLAYTIIGLSIVGLVAVGYPPRFTMCDSHISIGYWAGLGTWLP